MRKTLKLVNGTYFPKSMKDLQEIIDIYGAIEDALEQDINANLTEIIHQKEKQLEHNK